MADGDGIRIRQVDHIGIRVSDPERAIAFYRVFGFEVAERVTFDDVIIIRNPDNVEINLVVNANDLNDGKNVLMDVEGTKYPGLTHVALRVESVEGTIRALKANDIRITQGPVTFGRDGHVSVFVRDPDRNVIELRGRAEDPARLEGVTQYEP